MKPVRLFSFLLAIMGWALLLPVNGCASKENGQTDTVSVVSSYPQEENDSSEHRARRVLFASKYYNVFTADYPEDTIRMYWKDRQGAILRSLGRLKEHVAAGGQELVFATNGGMYMEDNSPQGLYIENGKQIKRIDTIKKAAGNFHMQPNGVFLLTETSGMVVRTEEFERYRQKAVYATQSGPMLVIDGKINAQFKEGSQNLYIRSGVGIDQKGRVVFAISEGLTNFYDFAALFKEELGCDQALYLDGAISRMHLPEIGKPDEGGNFGVMIGLTEKK